jgi:hypothetical protein
MLRVLAREALDFATLHGAAQLTFHGYRVDARRLCVAAPDQAFVEITLAAARCGAPLDRVRIAVASRSAEGSACRIDCLHAPASAACMTDFLAGCVSPVDARYASPETGQIS